MSSVLCVTQSGEAGVHAQSEVIRLAKDSGEPIVFLYVADCSFLDKLAALKMVDIHRVLERMGRFLLYVASERARRENVVAKSVLRHGTLCEVLPEIITEIDPSTIIVAHLVGNSSSFNRNEINEA
jgi:hypothetical protein